MAKIEEVTGAFRDLKASHSNLSKALVELDSSQQAAIDKYNEAASREIWESLEKICSHHGRVR